MPIDDYAGDTPTISGGKFILIQVPNFNVGVPGIQMSSYLRIGATDPTVPAGVAPTATPDPWGEDLAALVHGFTDDLRGRAGGGIAANLAPPLMDENEASLAATTARRVESASLHSKGGWRDHSDGNRITTTRGDKVEVIRGNYKLVVLGRSDLPTAPPTATSANGWDRVTGMELAGGNVDTAGNDLAFGMLADPDPTGAHRTPLDPSRDPHSLMLQTTYEWHPNSDGTWGWTQTTTVGSPDVPPGNNRIISNTWVDYQETNLGSGAKHVATILSNTWGDIITTNTHGGEVQNYTDGSKVGNTTSAPIVTNLTLAALQESMQVLGFNISGNVIGASVEIDMGGMFAVMQVAGLIPTILEGVVFDQHNGIHIDDHLGTHLETHTLMHGDVHLGIHNDNHIGVHFDTHLGTHFDASEGQIKIGTTVVGTYTAQVQQLSGADISVTQTNAHVTNVHLQNQDIEIHA